MILSTEIGLNYALTVIDRQEFSDLTAFQRP